MQLYVIQKYIDTDHLIDAERVALLISTPKLKIQALELLIQYLANTNQSEARRVASLIPEELRGQKLLELERKPS